MSTLRQASFPIPYFKVSPASEASREVANLYQGNKHSLTNAPNGHKVTSHLIGVAGTQSSKTPKPYYYILVK